MKYTLYINLSDPSSIYREAECNKGIDQVPALLDEIRRRGEVVQIRNAAEMSKEELLTAYFTDAAVAAVYGKYRVRTVFGSNRQPGSHSDKACRHSPFEVRLPTRRPVSIRTICRVDTSRFMNFLPRPSRTPLARKRPSLRNQMSSRAVAAPRLAVVQNG